MSAAGVCSGYITQPSKDAMLYMLALIQQRFSLSGYVKYFMIWVFHCKYCVLLFRELRFYVAVLMQFCALITHHPNKFEIMSLNNCKMNVSPIHIYLGTQQLKIRCPTRSVNKRLLSSEDWLFASGVSFLLLLHSQS